MNIVAVVNRAAGSGRRERVANAAVARLRSRGHALEVIDAPTPDEATRRLDAATATPDVSAIVTVGGDGTARSALAIARARALPLGIVPTGTGNDLARTLGLDPRDPLAAADVIHRGATRTLDLVRIRDRVGRESLSAGIVACGFDARVNARANAMTWPRGRARYSLALLREFAGLRPEGFTLEWDDEEGVSHRVAGPFIIATVGAARTYGGGIPISPHACPDDGLLDITLIRPAGRVRLLTLLPRLYRGTHVDVREVATHRARRVRVDSGEALAYADGDPAGELPLDVAVLPAAIRAFSPLPRG